MRFLQQSCLPFLVIAWFAATIALAYPVHPRDSSDLVIRDALARDAPYLALRFDPSAEVENLEARQPIDRYKMRRIIRKAKRIVTRPYHAIMDRVKPPRPSSTKFYPERMVKDKKEEQTQPVYTPR